MLQVVQILIIPIRISSFFKQFLIYFFQPQDEIKPGIEKNYFCLIF